MPLIDLYGSMLGDIQTREQTRGMTLLNQQRELELETAKQSQIQQAQRQERTRQLMQEEQSKAKPLTQYAQGEAEETAALAQSANQYFAVAKQLQADDPKSSIELFKQGKDVLDVATKKQEEQAKRQKDVAEHISSWAGVINSQKSLEQARQTVESRHPGTWASMKLPTVFTNETAPVFKRLHQASLSALQNAELQIKQIELKHSEDYYKARADKERALTEKARREAARAQSGLPRSSSAKTPYDKYLEDIEKEDKLYASTVEKIMVDSKKYPDKPLTEGKLWWKEDKPSKRQQALAAADTAHKQRQQAIQKWAKGKGIQTDFEEEEPKSTATYEEGRIYQDANGKKARYVKGKWEPI
jgi:hypothetical protein